MKDKGFGASFHNTELAQTSNEIISQIIKDQIETLRLTYKNLFSIFINTKLLPAMKTTLIANNNKSLLFVNRWNTILFCDSKPNILFSVINKANAVHKNTYVLEVDAF